jgi:uncharacterized protein YndB with AHSA1/START domain
MSKQLRRRAFFALLAGLLSSLAPLSFARAAEPLPEGVVDQSFALADGERVLQLATVVEAPVARAWAAFASEEGFRAWAVPLARIDLRVGGSIESSYDPKVPLGSGKTIRNEIVALVPERLLVIRNVQAPPGVPFDAAIFQSTQTAMWFEPLDAGRTRITLAAGRFLAGPAYDGVYRFFHAGNAYTLGQLRRHLAPAAAAAAAAAAK